MAANQTYATTFCQGFVAANQTAAILILPNLSRQSNYLFLPHIMASHTCSWYLTLDVANCGHKPNNPLVLDSRGACLAGRSQMGRPQKEGGGLHFLGVGCGPAPYASPSMCVVADMPCGCNRGDSCCDKLHRCRRASGQCDT